jgi:hypothetical protein
MMKTEEKKEDFPLSATDIPEVRFPLSMSKDIISRCARVSCKNFISHCNQAEAVVDFDNVPVNPLSPVSKKTTL